MDPSVPPPPPPARYVAPTPSPPSGGWPTPAIVTLAVVVLLGVLGGLVGQLQAKNARDEKAALQRELDQTEGDIGSVLDELRAKVDELTTENSTLTDQAAQAGQAAADLDAANAKLAERDAQIADLTAQLESAGAASESIAALFPVGLEDLAKVDLAASAVTLTARVGDCTYSAETCDRLRSAVFDADVYQAGGQWLITVRANGGNYFQAALVLDETGSFSGSEYISGEASCDGSASKPFATISVNPVEFTVAEGRLRATRFRGRLQDATDCGASTFSFEGRTG